MNQFDDEKRIILVGKTGTGKSSLGNTILNHHEFEVGHCAHSTTDKSSFGERIINKKQLLVVDTPGLLDTHRRIEEIQKEIIKSVGLIAPGPHAVLYVMRVGDKLTNDELTCVQKFTNMFGERVFNFVIIVFTKGNDLQCTISEYISHSPEPFRDLYKKCDNRIVVLDNNDTDHNKSQAVDNLLHMIETINYKKEFYSNKMLKAADKAILKRMKELGHSQAQDVRKEIKNEGIALKYLVLVGVGAFAIGLVGGPAILAAVKVPAITTALGFSCSIL